MSDRGGDNRYYMYCEDTEWCTSMRASHYQVVYYSDASVLHYGQGTSARMADRMSKAQSHSVLLFMQDHYGYLEANIVKLFMLIYFLVRTPLWAAMVVFRAQKKKAAQTVQIYCQMIVWHLLWFCRRTKAIV
jgi:GT2 family glycosyltransferase